MDKSKTYYFFVLLFGILIFMLARSLVTRIGKPVVPPSTVIPMSGFTSTPGGRWIIQKPKLSDFDCGPNGEVNDALVSIGISGGVPPYFVQFNSDNPVYEIIGVGITFRLTGGAVTEISMYDSQEGERNEDTIDVYVPVHHSECESDVWTGTATVITAVTPTDSATATPSITVFYLRTSTPARGNNNPAPPVPGNTQIHTATPVYTPTNTPLPPTFTNTPLPPTFTNTPLPSPTNTPIPGRPQCDDGIDNDGDGKFDKDDKECQNKHDNDESK